MQSAVSGGKIGQNGAIRTGWNYGFTTNKRVNISINPVGLLLFLCKLFPAINISQTFCKQIINTIKIKSLWKMKLKYSQKQERLCRK